MKKFAALLLLAGLIVPELQADERLDEPRISRDKAARIAQDQLGGRLLDIRPQGKGENIYYRAKSLKEGRVRVIHIDGQTGEVKKRHESTDH